MTPRQFAVKAIHEDKLNVKNPSILAKLLTEYAEIQSKQAYIDGTNAGHRAYKERFDSAMNKHQTRTL